MATQIPNIMSIVDDGDISVKSLDIGYTRGRNSLLLVGDGKDICITEQVALLPHFFIKT